MRPTVHAVIKPASDHLARGCESSNGIVFLPINASADRSRKSWACPYHEEVWLSVRKTGTGRLTVVENMKKIMRTAMALLPCNSFPWSISVSMELTLEVSTLTEYDRGPPGITRETNSPNDILHAGDGSESPFIIDHDGHCVYECTKEGFGMNSHKPHAHKQAVIQYACIFKWDQTRGKRPMRLCDAVFFNTIDLTLCVSIASRGARSILKLTWFLTYAYTWA